MQNSIDLSYTDLKAIILAKGLLWQYTEDNGGYDVFANDNLTYNTRLYKAGYAPIGCATCVADRVDFETNYKTTANQPIMDDLLRTKALYFGHADVITAGTRVILMDANNKTNMITIKAHVENVGTVYVGNNTVTSANGFCLEPGSTLSISHDHFKVNLYIDATVNGDGVCYIAGGR